MMKRPEGWAHEAQTLEGRNVMVTGGTTGIGRATARLLAVNGANVMIYGRDGQALQDALRDIKQVAAGKVYGNQADQADSEQVAQMFREFDEHFGELDILINNAALPAESTTDMQVADIEYVIKSNLLGYMVCAHHAVERMSKAGQGHIVNIGSLSAEVREKGSDVYVATKSGIQGWSEALRKQLTDQKIRVSLLELGMVGTNLHGEPPDVKGQRKKIEQGKMLTSEDIAEAVYYCLVQPPRCDVLEMRISPHEQGL